MKKTLARHKWLVNCTISEMIDTVTEQRYFVATVCGWNGFYIPDLPTEEVISEVKGIRGKIEAGDKEVFENPKYFKETVFGALAAAEEEAYRRLAVEYVVVNTNDVDDEYRYYRETHPIKTRWGGAASIRCWGPLHAAIRFQTREEAEDVAELMEGEVEEVYPF